MYYDIFNGDADGIIALLQLRLAVPRESQLVTGVKRDISLLHQVTPAAGNQLTVLDISMEKNYPALLEHLELGTHIWYADHHRPGNTIPNYPNLSAHINQSAETCTALIVDNYLKGEFHHWAIVAAYGDNLIKKADELAEKSGLTMDESRFLKELGTLINYNSYGHTLSDLHIHPADLYRVLLTYVSPFELQNQHDSIFYRLRKAYQCDLAKVMAVESSYESDHVAIFQLGNTAAARRISGVWGNRLANKYPDRAHIILTEINASQLRVSLRAPLAHQQGAGDICAQFETGGGRSAAAGINVLAKEQLRGFVAAVEEYYCV